MMVAYGPLEGKVKELEARFPLSVAHIGYYTYETESSLRDAWTSNEYYGEHHPLQIEELDTGTYDVVAALLDGSDWRDEDIPDSPGKPIKKSSFRKIKVGYRKKDTGDVQWLWSPEQTYQVKGKPVDNYPNPKKWTNITVQVKNDQEIEVTFREQDTHPGPIYLFKFDEKAVYLRLSADITSRKDLLHY